MKTAVITGGDGFIGSHLTKELISYGYEVYALVIPESNTKNRLAGLEHVHVLEGYLNQYEELSHSLPENPDVFYHFAWMGVAPDQRANLTFQLLNVELSTNAVRLASMLNAGRFVFPGSTMEYIYYGKPIDKNAVPSPTNAYGVAKIAAKYACDILCQELKIPYIYTVISSIYSEDRKDNNVIYYTIMKLLKNEKPSLTKLEQLWDYIHIDDAVLGLRLIGERGKPFAFYALGHGDNWPLHNYIYIISDLIGKNLPLGIGDIPYSSDKIPCSCVNLESIYNDTGFVPVISFQDGISRVIQKLQQC